MPLVYTLGSVLFMSRPLPSSHGLTLPQSQYRVGLVWRFAWTRS
jgi:hypothetical protein